MGIDYFRFRLKPGLEPASLEPLIEQQAVAFQSMAGWNSNVEYDVNQVSRDLREHLHWTSCVTASKELRNRIELPEWDDQNQCAADISDLDPCWRVYPITDNPVFPPLWRMQAYRTFLPDELRNQISEWRQWIREVLAGEHDAYLRTLHMHETSDSLRYHWSLLHGNASSSLKKTTNWANKPELQEVREQILQLPEPLVTETRIAPPESPLEVNDETYTELFETVRHVIGLTREWDRRVPGGWKVRTYQRNYHLTFDEFKRKAEDDWLNEFFAWGDRCVEQVFGWFLDY